MVDSLTLVCTRLAVLVAVNGVLPYTPGTSGAPYTACPGILICVARNIAHIDWVLGLFSRALSHYKAILELPSSGPE